MTITPQGQLYLCKTPLENDYKNQLTFSNATTQYNYFASTIKHSYSDYTYIKKDNVVNIGDNIDNIIDCNYLFYKNVGFSDRWYYCFITNMEYVNENCTRVTFETDCFQTWQFNIKYNRCFVEREHVNDDTIGLHTVPENLELGEYVTNNTEYYDGLDDCCFVLQCTEWTSNDNKPLSTSYGGIPMAGGAYVCDNIVAIVNILQLFANEGKSDAVYNLYMIPKKFITYDTTYLQWEGQSSPITDNKTIKKLTSLNGYTPINKKLLTFPYCYLLLSNNNGSSNILHFERFGGDPQFIIKGVPVVGGSIKCQPQNYDDFHFQEEMGLMAGKLPTLNWSDDEYTNWLTQNSVNIGLGVASAGLTIAGGIGMMAAAGGAVAGAGAIVSGAMAIANELGAVYQHSLQPNSAKGNVNGGDINVCSKTNGFYFYSMSIKEEYARIIDNYFSMFGYKINRVKVPNITGRSNWNYVKTISCNFDGDIPQTDLNIIRKMFDNGVTLWHSANTMYDYSNSNNII